MEVGKIMSWFHGVYNYKVIINNINAELLLEWRCKP